MARDTGAVVSIGYQGLPEVVAELLSFYRYSDIKKLIKTTGRMRTYIYYRGKLYIKGVPKPYKKTIDLGVATREEVTAVEEVKAEEGPSGGAFTPSLMAGDWGEGLAGPVRLPRGLNAPLGRPVEEARKPIVKELKLEEEEIAEEKPTEAVKEEKPVESTEEAVEEGPRSSRVDPLGGIPIQVSGEASRYPWGWADPEKRWSLRKCLKKHQNL
jgi:hypothetical protein